MLKHYSTISWLLATLYIFWMFNINSTIINLNIVEFTIKKVNTGYQDNKKVVLYL